MRASAQSNSPAHPPPLSVLDVLSLTCPRCLVPVPDACPCIFFPSYGVGTLKFERRFRPQGARRGRPSAAGGAA